MPDTERARQVLAEAMEHRQAELGKTWRRIATDGGISYETVRAVRKGAGKGPLPAPTRRALERGLEWPLRHIDSLLASLDATANSTTESTANSPDSSTAIPAATKPATALFKWIDDPPSRSSAEVAAEPDLRDDVERDLWHLATTRGLGERGAWLLINAYRADQTQQHVSHELGRKQIG